LVCLEISK